MEGYNVVIEKQLSKKEYSFQYLESRLAIEKDLRDMGFTRWEILAASFIPMTLEEIKKAQEMDIEW